jgi:hypothetical protein
MAEIALPRLRRSASSRGISPLSALHIFPVRLISCLYEIMKSFKITYSNFSDAK